MKELLNKTIIGIYLSEDNQVLVFVDSNEKKYKYEAYADCCSSSWFSHIIGVENLLGQEIISVVEREEFTNEDQEKAKAEYRAEKQFEPDYLQLYGIMLKTNKGTCDIEFRNESNGYYGGSCGFAGNEAKIGDMKHIRFDL